MSPLFASGDSRASSADPAPPRPADPLRHENDCNRRTTHDATTILTSSKLLAVPHDASHHTICLLTARMSTKQACIALLPRALENWQIFPQGGLVKSELCYGVGSAYVAATELDTAVFHHRAKVPTSTVWVLFVSQGRVWCRDWCRNITKRVIDWCPFFATKRCWRSLQFY